MECSVSMFGMSWFPLESTLSKQSLFFFCIFCTKFSALSSSYVWILLMVEAQCAHHKPLHEIIKIEMHSSWNVVEESDRFYFLATPTRYFIFQFGESVFKKWRLFMSIKAWNTFQSSIKQWFAGRFRFGQCRFMQALAQTGAEKSNFVSLKCMIWVQSYCLFPSSGLWMYPCHSYLSRKSMWIWYVEWVPRHNPMLHHHNRWKRGRQTIMRKFENFIKIQISINIYYCLFHFTLCRRLDKPESHFVVCAGVCLSAWVLQSMWVVLQWTTKPCISGGSYTFVAAMLVHFFAISPAELLLFVSTLSDATENFIY